MQITLETYESTNDGSFVPIIASSDKLKPHQ